MLNIYQSSYIYRITMEKAVLPDETIQIRQLILEKAIARFKHDGFTKTTPLPEGTRS